MSAKTTIQLKVDKKLNRIFNGHAQIKGIKKEEAQEKAMQLYIDKCEKEQRDKNGQ
jgi:hypothetical protein